MSTKINNGIFHRGYFETEHIKVFRVKIGDPLLRCFLNLQLCKSDIEEVEGCSKRSWQETLEASCLASREYLWVSFIKGCDKPCGVFGVACEEEDRGLGIPWLLSDGEAQKKYPKECQRTAKAFMAFIQRENGKFYALANISGAPINSQGHRWLKSLGFKFDLHSPLFFSRSKGKPYYVFTKNCRKMKEEINNV